MFFKRYKNPT